MNQPFINQGQLNQAQIPSNPQYMMPPNMNPAPGQPYPPVQAQGVASPMPQISPQPGYSPQVGIAVQPAQPVNNDYKNYNNISQIPHKNVFQPDANTFYISIRGCSKVMPFIFAAIGIMFFILITQSNSSDIRNFLVILGVLFMLISLLAFCRMFNYIFFILGPNNLTIKRKAFLGRKTKIYSPGELQRIEFNSYYNHIQSGFIYNYAIVVVPTKGNAETIFSTNTKSAKFTLEEINYFLYFINAHIQAKMRV